MINNKQQELFTRWKSLGYKVTDLAGILQNSMTKPINPLLIVEWSILTSEARAELTDLIEETSKFLDELR